LADAILTESEFLAEVYKLADAEGVFVHHCGIAWRCHGDGWPDLVLVGTRGVLYREVKASPDDRMRPEQTALLWLLRAAGQDAEVWTEKDLASGTVAWEIRVIA
jgi:hypothetical protein